MSIRYAVNACDLAATSSFALAMIVMAQAPSRQIVDAEPSKVAGDAFILETEPEQAQALCQVIRVRYKRDELRCYELRGKRTCRRI